MTQATGVGVIGCGNISAVYLRNLQRFPWLRLVACADLDMARAGAAAKACGVGRACTPENLLTDPDIQIVVNLTVPAAHAPVSEAALDAGKSVYSEKPLALTRNDARRLCDVAKSRNLRIGCAPDTILGAGIQSCIQLIHDGAIGRPVAATAFFTCPGHESWHPDPAFYYQPGGGPMFDMGPYYLAALVAMLGPVRRVAGMTARGHAERVVGSGPRRGASIPVQVPTHVTGLLELADGVIVTLVTSFDVPFADLPRIEVYGSEGSLSVPDPNGFGGPVRLCRRGETSWREMPLTHGYLDNWRGLGVADMARAIETGRQHRCSEALALHVVDVMQALHESAAAHQFVDIVCACERPQPLPPGLAEGVLD
ncbi:MAG: Gfo/Idh/MocA family oxidoreductase [Candidatus Sumerlaeaceae bacterium]|nr:Gfo/Idh/MocA family oxidoreductase [Candidatus Sumerlaeaceae bacterium]